MEWNDFRASVFPVNFFLETERNLWGIRKVQLNLLYSYNIATITKEQQSYSEEEVINILLSTGRFLRADLDIWFSFKLGQSDFLVFQHLAVCFR